MYSLYCYQGYDVYAVNGNEILVLSQNGHWLKHAYALNEARLELTINGTFLGNISNIDNFFLKNSQNTYYE